MNDLESAAELKKVLAPIIREILDEKIAAGDPVVMALINQNYHCEIDCARDTAGEPRYLMTLRRIVWHQFQRKRFFFKI
ncbi:MAG TPA: hypothetical protein ENN85_07220 [Methanoculleus sp.]|nr:hypothetical protein [Methanoculleus sp.]